MNDDLDRTICSSTFEDAVESQCCGGRLYCPGCSDKIDECPICRAAPFGVVPNHFVRRMIRCCKDLCQKCGRNVLESEMAAHTKRVCPKRDVVCVAKGCSFEGLGEDILEHVSLTHADYLIAMTTGEPYEEIFGKRRTDTEVESSETGELVCFFAKFVHFHFGFCSVIISAGAN